jgi:hypothetical protein
VGHLEYGDLVLQQDSSLCQDGRQMSPDLEVMIINFSVDGRILRVCDFI